MMSEAIKDFSRQFLWKPKVENFKNFKKKKKFLVCGMGGSQLATDILKAWDNSLDLAFYRDYDLPQLKDLKDRLIILSSYSGNTEEVISGFNLARKNKLSMAVIAVGGELIKLAKKYQVPYIQIPDTNIQPRSALGFSLLGLMKLMSLEKGLRQAFELAKILKPLKFESNGRELAKKIKGFVPVIYSSRKNCCIAYNWKIKLNETGKIPAFFNLLPELNHNEMNSFDVQKANKELYEKFYFIFIKDSQDHQRIQKRFQILKKLFSDRNLPIIELNLIGKNYFERVFNSLILADWLAVSIADSYGLESEQVPMVEEFKKLMKK